MNSPASTRSVPRTLSRAFGPVEQLRAPLQIRFDTELDSALWAPKLSSAPVFSPDGTKRLRALSPPPRPDLSHRYSLGLLAGSIASPVAFPNRRFELPSGLFKIVSVGGCTHRVFLCEICPLWRALSLVSSTQHTLPQSPSLFFFSCKMS